MRNENFKNTQESIPTKEKIKFVFETLLGLENYETLEEIYDDQGLCVWTIKVVNEDGSYKEYEYKRGGKHIGRKAPAEGYIPLDDIYYTSFDKTGMPYTGGLAAICKNGIWRNAVKSEE